MIFLFEKEKILIFLKILTSIALILLFLYSGAVGIFVMAISGTNSAYFVVFAILWLEFFILCMLLIWKRPLLKKIKTAFLAVFIVTLLGWGGVYAYEVHDDNIEVLRDRGIDLTLYEPFKEDAKVARLDKPSSLKFTEDSLPKIDSATALYPIAAAFVEAVYPKGNYAYQEQNILMQTTTRMAFNNLIEGKADIIFASIPSQEQLETAKEKGVELHLTPIGKEGFVFFVNDNNPVQELTIEQIQDIYSGKITNWSKVGGNNEEIEAFQREKNSGSQTRLEELMQGKELLTAPMSETRGGMGGIIRRAADYKNYKNALGFSFRYYASEMVDNKAIKLLHINGIPPTKETIRTNEYPLTGQFYAITTGNHNEQLEKFIGWILSEEGQELIEKSGYVRIK